MATILIVDDRPTNRQFLRALFGDTGHALLDADDGAQALALARRERPDLIITDILTPSMDGYEFVQQLRADPLLAGIRVIFFSAAYAANETLAMARSCGVSAVLPKPSDPHTILAAVNRELGLDDGHPTLAGGVIAAGQAIAELVARYRDRSDAGTGMGTAEPDAAGDISALLTERIDALQGMAARLSAMEDLGLRLTGERRVEAMIAIFMQVAHRVMDSRYLALCLLDTSEQTEMHVAAHGFDGAVLEAVRGQRDRLPGSLLGTSQIVRLAVTEGSLAGLPAGHPPVKNLLGLPIRDLNHLYGWLYFADKNSAGEFSEEDERVATALAAQLAVAYENISLYQMVQRHAAQLQLEANARQRADAALRVSEERLRLSAQVFDSTQESITVTDVQGYIVAVNPAFEHITGYSEAEVMGLSPRILRSGRHDALFYRNMWDCLATEGQWQGEIWNRRKNGQVYPERLRINVVRNLHNQVSAYVSVASDITALTAARHQLDFLSNHDPLTLLPNRTLLNDRLQLAMAAAEHGGRQIALLLFNIDRLQRINDSLGHEAGDALLQEMARRATLVLTPGDTLAHLGSDEFVLMLTKCRDIDDIIVAARRLMDDVAMPVPIDGQELFVTASIGISIYPRDGKSASSLLMGADVALSHVKDTGRNGFRFFTGEMNAHALRWMSLETHLRRALERQELLLHYQPQVELGDGRICGMEALLRWNSSELGPISPADFIPLAEDTGLILTIGAWVMHTACRQNKAWQDAGLRPLKMAVNVSARQFVAGNLPALVRSALEESGLAPHYLEIELTESVMMHDSATIQSQLAALHTMGVSVSLDDFGTGYSSLGYLSRFTLDKLKIDQSFVRNITTEPRSAAIAQATIALAHGLDLMVVAEGVETLGQLHFLRGIGCDEIQGFLFSQALPPDAFAALLREERMLQREALTLVPNHTVLLLDDETTSLNSLARPLRRDGYRILMAHSADAAFDLLAANQVQVIISSQRMRALSGVEFLVRAGRLYPDSVRLLLAAPADLPEAADAIKRGAIYQFLGKPWDDSALRDHIKDAFLHAERLQSRRSKLS
jgi:diguanylate cyclase (GGDEF)-like protein/PAS domain S-box-containing protein